MSKLKGAAKQAFLERMAKGRRKAARKNPARRKAGAKKSTASRTPRKKSGSAKNGKLRGAAKEAFLKRMAKGRRAAARNPKPARRRRRNEETTAAEMYEKFHQKPPGRTIEVDQTYHYPAEFAELGKLIELRFDLDNHNKDFPLTQFRGTRVVCTPDGANIYFIEGDQSIDFEAMDIATDKDMVELGPCTYICYHTRKGFHDFEPVDYFHFFGEEDGIYPVLNYDRLNKALFLVSGNYRVRPEGIVN
jgi:hypothetical protein